MLHYQTDSECPYHWLRKDSPRQRVLDTQKQVRCNDVIITSLTVVQPHLHAIKVLLEVVSVHGTA